MHFDHPLERMKRFVCRVFGHRFRTVELGAPVVPAIDVCLRCGKFTRTYWKRNH